MDTYLLPPHEIKTTHNAPFQHNRCHKGTLSPTLGNTGPCDHQEVISKDNFVHHCQLLSVSILTFQIFKVKDNFSYLSNRFYALFFASLNSISFYHIYHILKTTDIFFISCTLLLNRLSVSDMPLYICCFLAW